MTAPPCQERENEMTQPGMKPVKAKLPGKYHGTSSGILDRALNYEMHVSHSVVDMSFQT